MSEKSIAERLALPFDPEEIKWRPGAISGNRALALAYADARVVMDRLDDVLGVGNWQTTYREATDGVVCSLKVRLGGEWIVHEDFGGFSEQTDDGDRMKAAYSDALKRVAVHLGVGRFLYRLPAQWMDYDPSKRCLVGQPKLPASLYSPAIQIDGDKPVIKPPPSTEFLAPEELKEVKVLLARTNTDTRAFLTGMEKAGECKISALEKFPRHLFTKAVGLLNRKAEQK